MELIVDCNLTRINLMFDHLLESKAWQSARFVAVIKNHSRIDEFDLSHLRFLELLEFDRSAELLELANYLRFKYPNLEINVKCEGGRYD